MATRRESLLGTTGVGGLLAFDPNLTLATVLALQVVAFWPWVPAIYRRKVAGAAAIARWKSSVALLDSYGAIASFRSHFLRLIVSG
jgi:hypothetical protein